MKVQDVPQGKAFISYNSDNNPEQVYIKIHDDLFFHAMMIDEDEGWREMKSNYCYNLDQVIYNNDEASITTLKNITNIRLQGALKYIFEKMRA